MTYYAFIPGGKSAEIKNAPSTKRARTVFLDYLVRNDEIDWSQRGETRKKIKVTKSEEGEMKADVVLDYELVGEKEEMGMPEGVAAEGVGMEGRWEEPVPEFEPVPASSSVRAVEGELAKVEREIGTYIPPSPPVSTSRPSPTIPFRPPARIPEPPSSMPTLPPSTSPFPRPMPVSGSPLPPTAFPSSAGPQNIMQLSRITGGGIKPPRLEDEEEMFTGAEVVVPPGGGSLSAMFNSKIAQVAKASGGF